MDSNKWYCPQAILSNLQLSAEGTVNRSLDGRIFPFEFAHLNSVLVTTSAFAVFTWPGKVHYAFTTSLLQVTYILCPFIFSSGLYYASMLQFCGCRFFSKMHYVELKDVFHLIVPEDFMNITLKDLLVLMIKVTIWQSWWWNQNIHQCNWYAKGILLVHGRECSSCLAEPPR